MTNQNWKWQLTLDEVGISGLDDPLLNSNFVAKAREFLLAAQKPESDKAKLDELDQNLVELFYAHHTIEDEEDAEKVTAIRENAESKRIIAEMNETFSQITAENETLKQENERIKQENELLKNPPPPLEPPGPPVPTPADIAKDKRTKLLAVLNDAARTNKAIKEVDLITLGVPVDLFKAAWDFKYEGYTFDRALFAKKWEISK